MKSYMSESRLARFALDNESVTAPSGAPTRTPAGTGSKWRNLVQIAGGLAAVIGLTGYVAFGIGYRYEDIPGKTGTASGEYLRTTERNIVVPLMVWETTPGGFAGTGTGWDILTGITKNGSIVVESGSIVLGPDGAPNLTLSGSQIQVATAGTIRLALSGSYMRIGGGRPIAGQELTVVGEMSGGTLSATPLSGTAALVLYGGAKGSHLCIRDSDGAGWTYCQYLDGTATCGVAAAGTCP